MREQIISLIIAEENVEKIYRSSIKIAEIINQNFF